MGLLDGKAIIVTGAGRGLGRAYARALAGAGAQVVVNDINEEGAGRVVAEITSAGGRAIASSEDVAGWESSKRLVDQCVDAFGKLDVMVNNAGRMIGANLPDETETSIDATIRVNIKGVFLMARHALDQMMPQRSGCIINVSSGSQAGLVGWSVYGASKAAVAGFTYNLALETAEHNIRVNGISPFAHTGVADEAELPREMRPSNVAPLVVYLASDDAWWITGQIFRLQGNSFSLFAHPKPVHTEDHPDGWTVERIRAQVESGLRPRLEPVGLMAKEYVYETVLRPG